MLPDEEQYDTLSDVFVKELKQDLISAQDLAANSKELKGKVEHKY